MVINPTEVLNNKERINNLLGQLKKKVRGFEVINLRGQTIGFIKDFLLDKHRRLYMVIPKLDAQAESSVYLLSSQYIQKVDTLNKAIFVEISLDKFYQLPTYYISEDKATEFSKPSSKPPAAQADLTDSSEMRTFGESKPQNVQSFTTEELEEAGNPSLADSVDIPEVVKEQTVPLLEERVIVNRNKRKIGEVVVRKQIVTRMVEVPIQSEKLIIEKIVSDSRKPVEVESLSVDQVSNDEEIARSGHFSTTPATRVNVTNLGETPDSGKTQPSVTKKLEEVDNQSLPESDDAIEVVQQEIVRLLEERLVVNRSKWKVGEVVLRKEVENKIVQVPIRREKLIIEQVSPETKQIAEIDLGNGEVTGVAVGEASGSDALHREVSSSSNTPSTVSGEFLSPKAASHLLEAIALQERHGCAKVRVELVLDNPEYRETYQTMFDRCSKH